MKLSSPNSALIPRKKAPQYRQFVDLSLPSPSERHGRCRASVDRIWVPFAEGHRSFLFRANDMLYYNETAAPDLFTESTQPPRLPPRAADPNREAQVAKALLRYLKKRLSADDLSYL